MSAAEAIARVAHAGQVDKAGEPYIGHLERVAARLEAQGEGTEVVAAGWLHDVLEDTTVTVDDLRRFDVAERVITAVIALTHPHGEPSVVYYERVRANPDALAVKLADVADNADPARLARLDRETRGRLAGKYDRAVAALTD